MQANVSALYTIHRKTYTIHATNFSVSAKITEEEKNKKHFSLFGFVLYLVNLVAS